MAGRLEGRVALITGAAQGIGEAIARRFAAEGASVVVTDINVEEGTQVAKDIGTRATFLELDVSQPDAWTAAMDATSEVFGPLSILVNNAGFSQYMPIAFLTLDDYMAVINTNQVGTFLGMKAALAPMQAAGGGSIINVSSIFGLVGTPMLASYTATKFAIAGMTRVAAGEFAGSGIRVNCLHPGGVDTPAVSSTGSIDIAGAFAKGVPLQRIGTADEVAGAALFFASDDSSYCTGASLAVDGGMIANVTLDVT